jgi:hypothetical protein
VFGGYYFEMEGYKPSLETLKTEEYFNSEDILTAPASKLHDPRYVENMPNTSARLSQNNVEEMLAPITVLKEQIKEEPTDNTIQFVDVSPDQIEVHEFKIKDNHEQEKPNSSTGLKIKDFAVDPDSCSIVPAPVATQSVQSN